MGQSAEGESYRRLEVGAIMVFVAAVVLLVAVNPAAGSRVDADAPPSPLVEAYAIAMPNQGWAPMTVHFSAFGSRSQAGRVARIEWDLDGNGVYDTDATDQGGYASYHYAKPGRYPVTLRVTDEVGNSATDGVTLDIRHPASSSVDYWTVFDDSQVRRVDVSLTLADWERMWSDPEAKIEVPADALVFGEPLNDVGFRMRGQFSLRESGLKKPWKINVDAAILDQEYHNLRQLMFTNNIGDPTMMQEKLAYEMMHFAGVPASHVCYVEFWIDFTDDGEPPIFWGIYTLIERVDKKFLANRFGPEAKTGNLYKANHALRGPMDLIYYGDAIEDYPTQHGLTAYGKATNEESADYSDIIDLIRLIDGVAYPSPDAFAAAIEPVLNVDSFLRYMAVVVALGNWDSYPYTGNNFHLFNDPVSGRWQWIPWDLTWGGDTRHPLFELAGHGLVERAPLYDQVLRVEHYRVRFAGYLDLLARRWFTGEQVTALTERTYTQIAPLIDQGDGDKMFYDETAMFPVDAFHTGWQWLGEYAAERSQFILETLAQDDWRNGAP